MTAKRSIGLVLLLGAALCLVLTTRRVDDREFPDSIYRAMQAATQTA